MMNHDVHFSIKEIVFLFFFCFCIVLNGIIPYQAINEYLNNQCETNYSRSARNYQDLRDTFIGGAIVHHTSVAEADQHFRNLYQRWYGSHADAPYRYLMKN